MAAVIVMDEDEPSRALLVEWLAAAGHCVREAELREIEGGDIVDLVLIDLPRPRQQVAALVSRVRAAQPAAVLVGLSTQLRDSLPPGSALARSLGLQRLLAKPCSRQHLMAVVADALAAGRAR